MTPGNTYDWGIEVVVTESGFDGPLRNWVAFWSFLVCRLSQIFLVRVLVGLKAVEAAVTVARATLWLFAAWTIVDEVSLSRNCLFRIANSSNLLLCGIFGLLNESSSCSSSTFSCRSSWSRLRSSLIVGTLVSSLVVLLSAIIPNQWELIQEQFQLFLKALYNVKAWDWSLRSDFDCLCLVLRWICESLTRNLYSESLIVTRRSSSGCFLREKLDLSLKTS